MQKIRSLHLYLGCIFAPMLLFFAASGIWQTLGLHSHTLARLSTIHTSHGLKSNDGLTNFALRFFVLAMAVSFIVTTLLGVVMAIRFGRSRRVAYICLALGVALPVALIVWGLVARA